MKDLNCIFGTGVEDYLDYLKVANGRITMYSRGTEVPEYTVVKSNNYTLSTRKPKIKKKIPKRKGIEL